MSRSPVNEVRLELSGKVATIVLDNPGRKNAMGLSAWRTLAMVVRDADADERIRVIVLRGGGGDFGAGNDISEFGALIGDRSAAEEFGAAMAAAMSALEAATKPVIVAIEGVCYGASVALALSGDLRIAADDARFAITPVKLGALYLRSDLHRLVAAVGQGQARRLIYTAESIGADRAAAIGLVDEVVPAGSFDLELARRIDGLLQGSSYTLRRTKAMLFTLEPSTPPETAVSLAAFVDATQGADFAEGIAAFLTRRPPRFDRSDE